MTIRDIFAASVIGYIYKDCFEHIRKEDTGLPDNWRLGLACDAYLIADAMLIARSASITENSKMSLDVNPDADVDVSR